MRRSNGALIAAALLVVCLCGPAPAYAATSESTKSVEYFNDAQKYLKSGDVNAAIIQLKNSLQTDPNNVDSRRLLGEIYLRLGDGPAAEKELKAAAKRGAKEDKTLTNLIGQAYLVQGKYKQVLEEILDDVTNPDLRTATLLVRGRALLGLNRLDEAYKLFGEAEKLKPNDLAPKVGLAQALVSQGKLDEAEAKTDEALAISADSPQVLVLKGEVSRIKRNHQKALESFDKVIEIMPGNISARLGRAAVRIDLNKDSDAEKDLSAVFRRIPKHPLASYLLALIKFRKQDFRGAQEALQRGGRPLDDHLPSQFLKGATSYALNQLEQAEKVLEHYLQLVPNSARGRVLLGATLVRSKQHEKAIQTLEPLLGTKDESAQVLSLLGSSYMRTGNFAKSSELFERAASMAPNAAAIRTQLALSRLATGASNEAIGDLEAAIDLDPEARQAGILLALVRLRSGEFDEALKAAEQLKKTMPGNPLPLNLIGAAQIGKGLIKEARATFEQALKENPSFHPARMNLAQIDIREKKFDSARRQYETIIKQRKTHVGAYMALADIAAIQGRRDEVVDWLKKAVDANPQNATANLRLVSHYMQQREPKKALAAAREINNRLRNNPQVLEALGRAELANGEALASVTTYRNLVGISPGSPRALQLLAGAQHASKDIEGARRSYRKAVEVSGYAVSAYRALAEFEMRTGHEAAARGISAELEKKFPKSPAGRTLLGDIYLRSKKYDDALKAYEEAGKKGDSPELALRRHSAKSLAGRTDEALTELQGWVDHNDNRAVEHVLATAYISAKRYDDAIRASEKLLAKGPNDAIVLNNLAWLYDQKGDKRALDFAEKALAAAPQAGPVKDTLGWILAGRGQTDRAATLLREAHEAMPNSGDIAYHYAFVLNKTGRGAEAKRILQEVLKGTATFAEAENARKLLTELGG